MPPARLSRPAPLSWDLRFRLSREGLPDTLLNLLGMLDAMDAGEYLFSGRKVSALPEKQKASLRATDIGFIFQLYNLIPVLTAFENVELPLLLTNLSRRERNEHVDNTAGIEQTHFVRRKRNAYRTHTIGQR